MSLPVSLLPIELPRWDLAPPGDAVCVPVWSDVRPPRGAAGLLDWRMCGRLSSMLASGKVTGAEGEQTLFPSAHRLPWRLVLALGAGPRREFSAERLHATVRRVLKAAKGLGVRRLAFALPARDGEKATTGPAAALTSRRALDVVLEEVDAAPGAVDELTVIVPATVQKELAVVLRLRAVRALPEARRVPARRTTGTRPARKA
jgi:hypothetical protein